MINILGIAEKLNEFVKPLRDWIFKNHNNPLLWITLFLGGIIIFGLVYQSLQKEK